MGAGTWWSYLDPFGPGRLHGFTQANAGDYFDGAIPDTGRGPDRSRMRETLGALTPATQPLLRDHALQDWRDVVARADLPLLMVAGRGADRLHRRGRLISR